MMFIIGILFKSNASKIYTFIKKNIIIDVSKAFRNMFILPLKLIRNKYRCRVI